jgi:Zn-dependent alcohol dehydrogenase
VQGAKLAGAGTIVVLDPVEAKREAALSLGATHAFAPDDASDAIGKLTDGFGADTVLVATGAKPALEGGFALLARGGTLVVVGMPADDVKLELSPADLAHHGHRVIGSKMGSTRPDVDIPWLLGLYANGALRLDALISGRYPLEQLDDAIASVLRGEALRNVIVLEAA